VLPQRSSVLLHLDLLDSGDSSALPASGAEPVANSEASRSVRPVLDHSIVWCGVGSHCCGFRRVTDAFAATGARSPARAFCRRTKSVGVRPCSRGSSGTKPAETSRRVVQHDFLGTPLRNRALWVACALRSRFTHVDFRKTSGSIESRTS
jgi:hypothetical protein